MNRAPIVSIAVIAGLFTTFNAGAFGPKIKCCTQARETLERAGEEIAAGAQNGIEAVGSIEEQAVTAAESAAEGAQSVATSSGETLARLEAAGSEASGDARDALRIKAEAVRTQTGKASAVVTARFDHLAEAKERALRYRDSLIEQALEIATEIDGVLRNVVINAGECLNDAVVRFQKNLSHLSTQKWREYQVISQDLQGVRERSTAVARRVSELRERLAVTSDTLAPQAVTEALASVDVPIDFSGIEPSDQALVGAIVPATKQVYVPSEIRDFNWRFEPARVELSDLDWDRAQEWSEDKWLTARESAGGAVTRAWHAILVKSAQFDQWRLEVLGYRFRCGDNPNTDREIRREIACVQREIASLEGTKSILDLALDERWKEVSAPVLDRIEAIERELSELGFSPITSRSLHRDAMPAVIGLQVAAGHRLMADEVPVTPFEIRPGEPQNPGSETGFCHGASCPATGDDGGSSGNNGSGSGNSSSGGSPSNDSSGSGSDGNTTDSGGSGSIDSNGGVRPVPIQTDDGATALHDTLDQLRTQRSNLFVKIQSLDAAITTYRDHPELERFAAKDLDAFDATDLDVLSGFGSRVTPLWNRAIAARERLAAALMTSRQWAASLGAAAGAGISARLGVILSEPEFADLDASSIMRRDDGTSTFFSSVSQATFVDAHFTPHLKTFDREHLLAAVWRWGDTYSRLGERIGSSEPLPRRLDYIRAVHHVGTALAPEAPTSESLGIQAVEFYRDMARDYVESGLIEHRHERLALIGIADTALDVSRRSLAEADSEKAEIAARIAVGLLDASISMTPLIGWSKDIYEAVTGKNILTGERLSDFEWTLAVLGAATVGIGSKIKAVDKAFDVVHDCVRIAGESADGVARATRRAAEVLESAKKAKPVKIPYDTGEAVQEMSADALKVRAYAMESGTLFRIGKRGKSHTGEKAQFWSAENPLTPGYAEKYGIPPENIAHPDFMETAVLKDLTNFVTRRAPRYGSNGGGAIEVVVPEGGIIINSHTSL